MAVIKLDKYNVIQDGSLFEAEIIAGNKQDSSRMTFFGSPPESVGEIVWTSNHLRPVGF
jgi:hypothetical protein